MIDNLALHEYNKKVQIKVCECGGMADAHV